MFEQPQDILLARQPIFDDQLRIHGYELLYRARKEQRANIDNPDQATSELLLNVCTGLSDDELYDQYPMFFNISRNILLSESFTSVTPNRAVIELGADIVADEKVVGTVYRLRKMGFEFAIDGYAFNRNNSQLLKMAKYVKIDVLSHNPALYQEQIRRLMADGKTVIASKVEDLQIYSVCEHLGIKYFQGFFLEKPKIIQGKRISSNESLALQLITELQKADASFEKVSYMVSQDPKLSFQLLKILNSPAQGLKREVSSLKQAVVFLGLNSLKKWVVLISLVNSCSAPMSFFNVLLARARTCELYALEKDLRDPDQFFTAGLFSAIDTVLSLEMSYILEQIKLPTTLEAALLHKAGEVGKVLDRTIMMEKAKWSELVEVGSWYENFLLSTCYKDSVIWANELMRSLSSPMKS